MHEGAGCGLHEWAGSLVDSEIFSSVELDSSSAIRSASDDFFARTGYVAGELEGTVWDRLLHPDDVGWRAAPAGTSRVPEIRLRHKGGGWRWVRVTWRDQPDGTVRILLEDVTESKLAQADLLAAKERFELAVAGSADGIWDWNVVTNEGYFSERWCELLGFSRGELQPCYQTWVDLLHPEDRPAALAAVESHFSGQTPFDVEYRMRNKSGEYRWYRGRGQAIWDANGHPVRMAGSLKDIHDRKLDQMRLTGLNNRYEAAILASGQLVYEWDTVTGNATWSGDLASMLGEPVTELTRRDWFARIQPDDIDSVIAAIAGFLSSKGSLRHEYRIRKASGTWIYVEDRARFFQDGSGETQRVIGCVTDVTDRRVADRTRELEETRRNLQLALEGANEAVWEWTAPDHVAMSPEFGSLLGFAEPEVAHPDDYAGALVSRPR